MKEPLHRRILPPQQEMEYPTPVKAIFEVPLNQQNETLPLEGLPAVSSGQPLILAMGAGKGGAGKSLLSANLATLFAKKGRTVLLVDADLGSSNAHTFLGMDRPEKNLSHLLDKSVKHLAGLATQTPVANLHLISSAGDDPEMANIKYAHKEKILSQVKELPYQVVILDCGAGTSFNTLDFFLTAQVGMVILTPEPSSVEGAYRFLRALITRQVKKVFRKTRLAHLNRLVSKPGHLSQALFHPDLGEEDRASLMDILSSLDVRLLVNQVTRDSDAPLAQMVATICAATFPLAVSSLGAIETDPGVFGAQREYKAYAKSNPVSPLVLALERVAGPFFKSKDTLAPPPLEPLTQPFAMRDHYHQLGISPNIHARDLAKAYQVALEPFLSNSLAGYSALDEQERESFRELLEQAYRTLSGADARRRYDAELESQGLYAPEDFVQDYEDTAQKTVQEPIPESPAATVPEVKEDEAEVASPQPPGESEEDLKDLVKEVKIWNGGALKEMREHRNISLSDIALETRIRKWYLDLIEKESFKDLPALVYIRGFVKEYALMLGIPADKAVKDYTDLYRRWERLQNADSTP